MIHIIHISKRFTSDFPSTLPKEDQKEQVKGNIGSMIHIGKGFFI